MAPFVFYRLRQDQLQAAVSSNALTQLQHAYYLAAPRAALRTRELITVLQALAAHGIVPVLFKGAVLAHTVYPNYVCRPMSDLDLWLSDAEIEVAVHALAQIGYVQRFKPARPAALQALHEGEFKFYGPLRFLFLLAMVDRPLAAARLLGRAVWPEEAWLAARYGTGGVRVRVRHTFDAMRGRL